MDVIYICNIYEHIYNIYVRGARWHEPPQVITLGYQNMYLCIEVQGVA